MKKVLYGIAKVGLILSTLIIVAGAFLDTPPVTEEKLTEVQAQKQLARMFGTDLGTDPLRARQRMAECGDKHTSPIPLYRCYRNF